MPRRPKKSNQFASSAGWDDVCSYAKVTLPLRIEPWLLNQAELDGVEIQMSDRIAATLKPVLLVGHKGHRRKPTRQIEVFDQQIVLALYGLATDAEVDHLTLEMKPILTLLNKMQNRRIGAQIFERVPIIMYQAIELEGRWVLTRVNKALTDFLGVDEQDLIGAGARYLLTDFVHPDEVARLVASYDFTRTTSRRMTMHYQMRNAHGDYVPVTERVEYASDLDVKECTSVIWHSQLDLADSNEQYQLFKQIENYGQDIGLETGREFLLHFSRRLEAFDDIQSVSLIAHTKDQWWESWTNFSNSYRNPDFHLTFANSECLQNVYWNEETLPGVDAFVHQQLFGDNPYLSLVPLRVQGEPVEAALLIGSAQPIRNIEQITQMIRLLGVRILREIAQIRIADAQIEQNQLLQRQKHQLTQMVTLLGELDTVADEQTFILTIESQLREAFSLQCVDWTYWSSNEWHAVKSVADQNKRRWYQSSSLITKNTWLTYLESCRRSGEITFYRGRQRIFWPIGVSQAGFLVVVLTFNKDMPDAELLQFTQNALSLAQQGLIQRENLRFQAMHDSLTGLGNRVQLHAWVKVALPTQSHASLLLFDLNRFKEINDSFGHQFGDKLLQEIGPRISQSMDNRAFYLSRLGGDEFAMFLPDTTPKEAVALAEHIHNRLAESYVIDGLRFQVEASVGVAHYPEHGNDGHELLRCADVAMYEAKNSNRKVAVFEAALDNSTPMRIAVLSGLDEALDEGQLWVTYQPLMSTETGMTAGFEALVRWTHPTFGALSPADFIPIAEMGEGIRKITDFVLRNTLSYLKQWRQLIPTIHVAVNISPRVLLDHQFPLNVEALLAEYDLPGDALILELTESTLLVDPIRAVEIIKGLSELNVNVEIDDFGTGYSSLAYLKKLPISALKIDRSFVTDILEDSHNDVIVQSTIQMAHNLGLQTVAEGVEDEITLQKMMRLGCDIIQGYYYSKPIPGPEVSAWLQRNS